MKRTFKLYFLSLFIALVSNLSAQKGLVNNGALLNISEGAIININGSEGNYINKSFDASSHGSINLEGKLKLQGDWINNATSGYVLINRNDKGEVAFNGTTQQLIGGTQFTYFEDIVLDKTGTLRLSNATRIRDTLRLYSGLLNLKNYNFVIDSAGGVAGTPTATTMIVANDNGFVRKYFNRATSFTFPVGDTLNNDEYAPFTVTFNSGNFVPTSFVQVRTRNIRHPLNSSSTHYINRYWQVQSSNITGFNATITATYTTADLNAGANESFLYGARYENPYWNVLNQCNAATNTITANVNSFYDFTAGEVAALSPSIIISDNGISEGNENGRTITVTLNNDDFEASLNTSNWTINNLPTGVSVGTLTRTGDKTATIILSGNRTVDFDASISDVEVIIDANELVNLSSGTVSKNTGVTIVAVADTESIAMSDDGLITEGYENGEVITVTVSGGTFVENLTAGSWSLTGLPAGVSYSTPQWKNENTVEITLTGNAPNSYDADITDATLTVQPDQVDEYTGTAFSISTGITFSYVDESFSISIKNTSTINEGAESSGTFGVKINKNFATNLTLANWVAFNLPEGVSLNSIVKNGTDTATITLNGPSTKDYDTDITNISFQISQVEFSDYFENVSTETDIIFTAIDEGGGAGELLSYTTQSINEGSEDGQVIEVNLSNGTFINPIDTTKWTVSNLPIGVSVASFNRTSSTIVDITLKGNRRVDYDSDKTDLTVSVKPSQVDDYTETADLSVSSGITFAHNVAEPTESITLADDANAISEGAEHGEVITVTLIGGTFAQSLTPGSWAIANQPTGVSIGNIALVDSVTAKLTLSGNATADYDQNIIDFTVTVPESDVDDHTGSNLSANTNVLFIANDETVVLKIEDDIIKEGKEDGELITLTLQEDEFLSSVALPGFSDYYTLANLPVGVSKGTVTWENADTVTIALSGNRTQDFDADIENVTVSVLAGALVQHTTLALNKNSGVIIDANNDGELLVLSDNGITEGAENGKIITVEIEGGTFAPAITGTLWTVTGLPSNVTKGAFNRQNDTVATITLSGNANVDYDVDIENVTVTVPGSDVNDYSEAYISRSTGIVLHAIVEPIVLTIENDIDGIDEASENGEVISVTIENDIFITPIVPSNWSFTGLPQGVSIGSIVKTSPTTANITLSGNRTKDYDAHITNAELKIKGNQFVAQSTDVTDTGITFTANIDGESISMTDDGSITEGNEDGEVITVTANGGTFASNLVKSNWNLTNAPAGITIASVLKTSASTVSLTLFGNTNTDYDTDINNLTLSITDSEIDEYSGANLQTSTGVSFTAVNETLAISSSVSLNESNLNGAEILLELSNESYYNSIFDTANFSLNNAPENLKISSISYLSATQAELILEFIDTVDFDVDINDFNISIAAEELLGLGPVTSNNLSIIAINEDVAISISDNGIDEGAENGEVITVTLLDDVFEATLTMGNWELFNLPQGVNMGTVNRVGDNTATIELVGNRSVDFDNNIDIIYLKVKADEFVGSIIDKISVDSIEIIANNDVETLTLADTGIEEGAEDGEIIQVKLNGGTFVTSINPDNWFITGLPTGVSVDTIIKVDADSVKIVLQGNATYDYDSNITDVQVSVSSADFDEHSGGSIFKNTGVVFVANNDAEILTMVSDGLISEGAENGEILTVNLSGGEFAITLDNNSWSFENLPEGVSVDQINRINDNTVELVLLGNRTADYDEDITDFSITIDAKEVNDTDEALVINSGVTFTANIEKAQLVHTGLTEENLNGAVLTVNLLNETFADAVLADTNFIFYNVPNGFEITTITYKTAQQAEIAIAFDGTDFDTNLVDFCLRIEPLEVNGIEPVTSDSLSIIATNDDELLAMSDDGAILEGAEDGEVISVTLSGGTFANNTNINNWAFSNLPIGVQVSTLNRVSSTQVNLTLQGNATTDYDTDITSFSVAVLHNEINDFSAGVVSVGSGVTFIAIAESLTISSNALSESNLNGAEISLALSNELFVDNILEPSNFVLNNIPPGVSIASVTYVSETSATILLKYDGTDFDADSNNVSITILPAEIIGIGELRSNTISISSNIESQSASITHEGLTEENLNGAVIELTLSGDTFVSSNLPVNSFSINGGPIGAAIEVVNYVNDSIATVSIIYDGTDFDTDKNNFNISINANLLSLGAGITTNSILIKATNDVEQFVLSYDGLIEEGTENGENLSLAITGGNFTAVLTESNWGLVNSPAGLSIGELSRINDTAVAITIAGNASADYDKDILNFGISINQAEVHDYTGADIVIDTGVVLSAIIEAEPKLLHISSNYTQEGNLNGGIVLVEISGDYLIDSVVEISSIQLFNVPIGLTVVEASFIDSLTLQLTLEHDNTDFDEDYPNAHLSIAGTEFNGGQTIYSDSLTYTAIIENEKIVLSHVGLSEDNLNGIVITLSVVGDKFFDDTLLLENFVLDNAPDSTFLAGLNYINDTAAEITIMYKHYDFDNDIVNFGIAVKGEEFVMGNSIRSENATIQAINDPEILTMSDDGYIGERTVEGELITVSLTGGYFAFNLLLDNWTFTNVSDNLFVSSVTRINDTVAELTLSANENFDIDTDLDLNLSVDASQVNDHDGTNLLCSGGAKVIAIEEMLQAVISDSSESGLAESTISLKLINDKFIDEALDERNFSIEGFEFILIDSVKYLTDTTAIIYIAYNNQDFDVNQVVSARISGSELVYSDTLLSNNMEIIATNDDEVFALADDGEIKEGAENGEIITLTLTGGTFVDHLQTSTWLFENLPIGVTVDSIYIETLHKVKLRLNGNATMDYDTNLTQFTVIIPDTEFNDYSGASVLVKGGVVFTANQEEGNLTVSSQEKLTEQNLNGAVLDLVLDGASFVTGVKRNLSAIVLNNAPDGLSASEFNVLSDSSAQLKLAYLMADFDVDYNNFSVTVESSILNPAQTLTSNALQIKAIFEPEIIVDYDGEILEGFEQGEIMEVSLIQGKYKAELSIDSLSLTNLPIGVSVGNMVRLSDTLLSFSLTGNRTVDYDYNVVDVYGHFEDGMFESFAGEAIQVSTPIMFVAYNEQLEISSEPLNAGNLNGAVVKVSLTDDFFLDNDINMASLSLHNSPAGLSIGAIANITDTTAELNLNFDGTEMNADINNFFIEMDASELHGVNNLQSNHIEISKLVGVNDIFAWDVKIYASHANVIIAINNYSNGWNIAEVNIYDATGKRVYNSLLNKQLKNSVKLEVLDGFYFVKVNIDGIEFVGKVFILPD